ncbi:aspartyl/glutamyl-tRNA(Asn/Gln) amidotransferase subunit A [Rhodoferax ferrireducens T118]|uniref:Aspartyl/glutamyl-tRNA(Asn/Gln) amidotransferase subunit A n=1 Tax=Albidiferax ferrireducens (strain ATCC BAA-621 / DSM 15236 / T118) TaxID=338969 RepID=Q21ZS0_ALBFT|nr:amidase [Rhodoferax ferrireducens]ABD68733.1 aspartyl/glutamyl-tRNA(Asn/Gln) amidotransferase subunit A [Rhodoferax ferrireducens T118]
MSDFLQLDLVGVADAIAQKRFSAQEIVAWSLQRLESIGRNLNAIFRIDHEDAMVRARSLDDLQSRRGTCGPLHGVPLAHKDLFGIVGRECHAGSLILRGQVAARNAWVIDELNAAGQVNLGSLHMAEFAVSPTGFNAHYGHGRNPWSPMHVCGGSSSGSGIAVASRLVFGSLGTDTGGSIRHPAAMCGVTGLKTTFRRVSVAGVVSLSSSLDCVGPLAQSARDCARLLTHISRPNPDDGLCTGVANQDYENGLDGDLRGLRVGVPEHYYRDNLDPEVAAALQTSLEVLRARGATLVTVAVPDMALINAMMQLIMSVEAAALHRKWIESRPQDYAEQVRLRIEAGFAYSAVRYVEALALRVRLTEEYLQTSFASCDLIHVPTIPVQTPTIAATTEGDLQAILQTIGRITHATRGVNYLGLPAISVPAGISSEGMPLSFQLIGRPFDEALLLKTADAFQRETDWHRRRPPIQ